MHDLELQAGHLLEQFAGDMRRAAVAGRCHLDGAGIGPRIGEELRHRPCRHGRMQHHHQRLAGDACDRHDVAQEVERQIGIERAADRVRRAAEQDGVAVGRRAHDFGCGNVAGPAALVLDVERLAELFRQPLRDNAAEDVVRAAGREADDEAHGFGWIGLGLSHEWPPREGRERRKLEETAARDCHGHSLTPIIFASRSGSSRNAADAPS